MDYHQKNFISLDWVFFISEENSAFNKKFHPFFFFFLNRLDEYEGEASFAFLNNFCPEESYRSFKVFTPKWRRAPRSPSDFSDSKTTISSCRDSDYERWLENYYNDLININHPKFDQQVDTSDLVTEKPQQFAQSIFTSIKKGPWMKRYVILEVHLNIIRGRF